jgi:hypothetical protein
MSTETAIKPPETIAERFARETRQHEIAILHDDGLYRHLRFQRPGTSSYAFELITVPNALIYRGEESYVFSRLRDMFEFFRSPDGHINPGYWSEKLTSDRDCVKKYDQALFEQLVRDHVAEAVEDDPTLRRLTDAVREAVLESDEIGFEDGARDALTSFAFYKNPDDRWDVDKQPDFQFHDTWEWGLRDYDHWFLWACHAIVWGIRRHDRARAAGVSTVAPALVTVEPVGGVL